MVAVKNKMRTCLGRYPIYPARAGRQRPLPAKTGLLKRIKLFRPSGKSILIFRTRVKPKNQKYSA